MRLYPVRILTLCYCWSLTNNPIILIIAFFFFGQSCARTDDQFERLLQSPDEFQGKEVEITGIIHERFGDSALYLTTNSSKHKAVWIKYSKLFMTLNTFRGLDGQRIKIKGEFDEDHKGHLGKYAGTLKETVIIVEW
ncbi:MAG: hypothetical protein JSS79_02290 [Bacteroidetes bacterium]|nr:hypothetical protein [Bacteroidota bacterium]